MTDEELRERIVAAVRKVPVRLGPNGKLMVEMGREIHLNMTESEKVADGVMDALNGLVEGRSGEDAAADLAEHIRSQPLRVVQRAFRELGVRLALELAGDGTEALCSGCGLVIDDESHEDDCDDLDRGLFYGLKSALPEDFPKHRIHDFLRDNRDML